MLPVAHHHESGSQSPGSWKMYRFTIITFSFIIGERVLALSIDQRQTGDLNVQIDLKNLNVFALTKGKEEYVDYDYAYDYSEMTIKPQNGTTSTTIKPLNATETVLQNIKHNATVTLADFELTTKNIENNATVTTEKVVTTDSVMIAMTTNASISTATVAATTIRHEAPDETIASTANHATNLSDCKKGFIKNSKGNCELKLQNPSNILLKMLQQKSKPSGGNGVRRS